MESKVIKKTGVLISGSMLIMFFGRHFIFFGILLVFVLDGRVMRGPSLYITLSSLNNMRKNTLSHMASAVRNTVQVSVTVSRVEVGLYCSFDTFMVDIFVLHRNFFCRFRC